MRGEEEERGRRRRIQLGQALRGASRTEKFAAIEALSSHGWTRAMEQEKGECDVGPKTFDAEPEYLASDWTTDPRALRPARPRRRTSRGVLREPRGVGVCHQLSTPSLDGH